MNMGLRFPLRLVMSVSRLECHMVEKVQPSGALKTGLVPGLSSMQKFTTREGGASSISFDKTLENCSPSVLQTRTSLPFFCIYVLTNII